MASHSSTLAWKIPWIDEPGRLFLLWIIYLLFWKHLKLVFLTYLKVTTEKAMAPHSSTLAWKIPWIEEPGGLQSMGSLRVGHD